jgi:hypothetical protein
MVRKRHTEHEHQLAVSDEAAAYIADALMQLALDFENTHYAQIRRHHQAIAPETDADARRLDLFPKPQPRDPS